MEWISVDTEMPEKDKKYTVSGSCVFKTKKKEFNGYYHYGDNEWVTTDMPLFENQFYRFIRGVTHWKPIEKHTKKDIDNLNGWVN